MPSESQEDRRLKATNALVLASLIVCSTTAWAHGPTRQKVVIEQAISAPPDKVWEIIGNFQDMSWHPAITKTEGEGGNMPGATRVLTLANGGQIFETLEKHDAADHSMFYRIENVDVKVLPVTNYSSWLSVTPGADGGSTVTWKGAFYRGYPNNDPPPELNDEASVAAVTGVYQAGLANVKTMAEQASP